MGHVIDENEAFKLCHGYKVDGDLRLWSKGVLGTLSKDQIFKCKAILIENAKGGPKIYTSVDEALKAEVTKIPDKHIGQTIAIRKCANILDAAEDLGLIRGLDDVYDLMDYCMDKLGYKGEKTREIREDLKEFVDKALEGKVSVPFFLKD